VLAAPNRSALLRVLQLIRSPAFPLLSGDPGRRLCFGSHGSATKNGSVKAVGVLQQLGGGARDTVDFERLRVPERQAQRQEAALGVHHGAEVPEAGRGEGRSDQGRGESAFWLSQLPACTGDGAGQTKGGREDGARDAASRGLRDDYAALRTVGHGVDARGTRQVPGAAFGRQDAPAHREGSVRNRRSDRRIVGWIVGWEFSAESH